MKVQKKHSRVLQERHDPFVDGTVAPKRLTHAPGAPDGRVSHEAEGPTGRVVDALVAEVDVPP
jgi:hypothetical protein